MQSNIFRSGLTGNQLKILAMIAMTCDHIGVQLFPQTLWLRVLGRLAMPIYAYMIAEGCRHTRDRKKYFLRLFGMGVLCQAVYFAAMGSLYMCILISLGIILYKHLTFGNTVLRALDIKVLSETIITTPSFLHQLCKYR